MLPRVAECRRVLSSVAADVATVITAIDRDAWKRLGNTVISEAKQAYVDLIGTLDPSWAAAASTITTTAGANTTGTGAPAARSRHDGASGSGSGMGPVQSIMVREEEVVLR